MAKKTSKKAPIKAENKESVVVPSISIQNHSNPFKEQLDTNKDLEIVAVGYGRVAGTNTYSSYTVYIKGGEITKIVVDEPNLKAIAEESAKIAFVNNFIDAED